MKTEKLKPRLRKVVAAIEIQMIDEAVQKYGSRELAAAALGITSQTIRRKLGTRAYVWQEKEGRLEP